MARAETVDPSCTHPFGAERGLTHPYMPMTFTFGRAPSRLTAPAQAAGMVCITPA